MPLKQGVLHHIERDRLDVSGVAPRRAYLVPHATVAGRYVLSTSSAAATAFLKASPIASAPGRVVLDDDRTTETHPLYLVDATRVII